MPPVIIWFRRNLRLRDNAALNAAVDSGQPIIPVYVADGQDRGGASRWWLHHSLTALDHSLTPFGAGLIVRRGAPERVIPELVSRTGASGVYFCRRYEPLSLAQEQALLDAVAKKATLHGSDDHLLRSPDQLRTKSGSTFKIFTPFWKASNALDEPPAPQPAPASLALTSAGLESLPIAELKLLSTAPDWAGGLRDEWTPGEDGALRRLDDIQAKIGDYAQHRDRPDRDATSRLSPHLHHGEVSPRQVWHAIRSAAVDADSARGADGFLRQLHWRDFSGYLLFHFPNLADTPLRPEFEHFPWVDDDTLLAAWQRGNTGYPIVDAGMRQLWASGWMHNRVRMLVASFLVKDLMISWQRGADWFIDTLVDADLANNAASWQWVAGCGTDAAPYFRIFNPVLQGKKFDPRGDYVRRWVPELERLPAELIHEPWTASHADQKAADTVIGEDYPAPIVDHREARNHALAAYQSTRDLLESPPGSSR